MDALWESVVELASQLAEWPIAWTVPESYITMPCIWGASYHPNTSRVNATDRSASHGVISLFRWVMCVLFSGFFVVVVGKSFALMAARVVMGVQGLERVVVGHLGRSGVDGVRLGRLQARGPRPGVLFRNGGNQFSLEPSSR